MKKMCFKIKENEYIFKILYDKILDFKSRDLRIMKSIFWLSIFLFIIMLCFNNVFAIESTNYKVINPTISSGAGDTSSANYKMGLIIEDISKDLSSFSYKAFLGFWYTLFPGNEFEVDSCKVLDKENSIYNQTKDILADKNPCIDIRARNVTFNGRGKIISNPNNAIAIIGIYSNQPDTKIVNCTVFSIGASSFNPGNGIRLDSGADYSYIFSCNISNNYGNGIEIYSNYNIINRSKAENNPMSNNIYLYSGSHNLFIDSNFSDDSFTIGSDGNSMNNSFVNCSYDTIKENVNSGSELIRKWYYQAYVNDSEGQPLDKINVSAFNVTTLANQFNLTTNESGWTNITTIIDYVNLGGVRNYYSNYTINATNGTHKDEHQYNVTNNTNNLMDVFTLGGSDAAPVIYYVENIPNPVPNPGGVRNVSVNFSVYDESGYTDINFSSIKVNITKNGVLRQNTSCNLKEFFGNYVNYTCVVPMWFFDNVGYWNISILIADYSRNLAINDTTSFHYNMYADDYGLVPGSMNWSDLKTGTVANQYADNNLTLFNWGNTNMSLIRINSTNLIGEKNDQYNLTAGNFSVDGCSQTRMIEDEYVLSSLTINFTQSSFTSNASGNLSFCVKDPIVNIYPQSYSSPRDWIIDVTFT